MSGGEHWLPIPGYEGRYDVSDLGRVRSWAWNRTAPRVLSACPDQKGYLGVGLANQGKRWTVRVHVLVLLAFVGPCPDGSERRHLDGDNQNNALTNLAYGTHSENELDRVKHGTHHNARKTHCSNGHPFTPDNTFVRPSGGRGCRECDRAKGRARYWKSRAA